MRSSLGSVDHPGNGLAAEYAGRFEVLSGLLIVTDTDDGGGAGEVRITKQGHPRLPAEVRRRVGLVAQDRVLVVLGAEDGRLSVLRPPAAVETTIDAAHTILTRGDAA